MPSCVPNLERTLLLTNYTQSQYSRFLNDSKFTGVGFGTEDNWMVVVLTTNTPGGSFTPATGDGSNGASFVPGIGLMHWLFLLAGSILLM